MNFSDNDPLRPLNPGELRFRSISYNVFGRWFGVAGYEGQTERLGAIPHAIASHPKLGRDVDVITVAEAWCPSDGLFGSLMCASSESRKTLSTAMSEAGWPYQSTVVNQEIAGVMGSLCLIATLVTLFILFSCCMASCVCVICRMCSNRCNQWKKCESETPTNANRKPSRGEYEGLSPRRRKRRMYWMCLFIVLNIIVLVVCLIVLVTATVKTANGGVLIYSKWPFLSTPQTHVYAACNGEDCHAAKGFVLARIQKVDLDSGISQVFNIFATHLQAWPTPEADKTREEQLIEIRSGLPSISGITENGSEVVLLQGDLNIDAFSSSENFDMKLNLLSTKMPSMVGKQLFSSDPSSNLLVGKDGAASKNGCQDIYMDNLRNCRHGNCSVPATACAPGALMSGQSFNSTFTTSIKDVMDSKRCHGYCPCCPHEMLDYIVWCADSKYLSPIASSFEIVRLKSMAPLTYKWGWCSGFGCLFDKGETEDLVGDDLSDHYPVVANFIFKP